MWRRQIDGTALRYSSANRGFPAGNPIANALVIIVGTLAIAASIVVGFLAFVVLGSALIVFAAIVGIRLWWFNRKHPPRQPDGKQPGQATIEGEYRIVGEGRDED